MDAFSRTYLIKLLLTTVVIAQMLMIFIVSCGERSRNKKEREEFFEIVDLNHTGLDADSIPIQIRGYFVGFSKLNSVEKTVRYYINDSIQNKCKYVPHLRHKIDGTLWIELIVSENSDCSYKLSDKNDNLEINLKKIITPHLVDTLNDEKKKEIMDEINSGFK